MGSGQRGGSKEDGVRNHFPGPGSYQDKGKNDAPKWGFGSESRTNINKNDNPPPG